jgi:gliding motility-associated-like protein
MMRLIIICLLSFYVLNGLQAQENFISQNNNASSNLVFIQNKNQWDNKVLYKADIPGGIVFLEKNSFTYNLIDPVSYSSVRRHAHHHNLKSTFSTEKNIKAHCLKLNFINSKTDLITYSDFQTSEYYNYFLGNNPDNWASQVYGFKKIIYSGIYSKIDMLVYSQERNMKYDFVVNPGGDPANILMDYEGAEKLSIQEGKLIIRTSVGEIYEQNPYAYQIINGKETEISCLFIIENKKVKFKLGDYNANLPLIIDPILVFSTYAGSTADNFGFTATFDSKGFLYSGSIAFSQGYYTSPGAYDLTFNNGNCDVVISKFDTTGKSIIYSTYLGGNSDEAPHSLIVNSLDELFIYGTTGSSNFPTSITAFDKTFRGGPTLDLKGGMGMYYGSGTDMFVSRLSADGKELLASTFIGGTSNDGVNTSSLLKYNYADEFRGEIDIDQNNNIYIVSSTRSTNFPVSVSAFQKNYGGGHQDAVIIKMDNNLTSIIWSSFLGGSGDDGGYSLSIDSKNDIYISGGSTSNNFPISSSAYQKLNNGNVDGFITKISSTGQFLLSSSYLGSGSYDQIYFVELDRQDNVYVFGQTSASGGFYIFNAPFNKPGGGQFITKLNPDLSNRIFSTAFGGNSSGPNISPTAFLVDVCNKMYISGWGGAVGTNQTNVQGLPTTPDAIKQTSSNGSDFYLMVLENDVSALVYGTFYGGNTSREHVDGGTSRFDRKGKVYQAVCAGCGGNNDFPIAPNPGAWSATNPSPNCNLGVFKIDFGMPLTIADFVSPPPGCAPFTYTFSNSSIGGDQITYNWLIGNTPYSSKNPTHTFNTAGTYQVRLITIDPNSCNGSDTIVKTISVFSNTNQTLDTISICQPEQVQIGISPINDPNVTYSWTPTTGLSDPTAPNPYAAPSQTTNYRLIVSNGVCADTIRQTVNVRAGNVMPDFNAQLVGCTPHTINFQNNSTATSSSTFQWTFGDGSQSSNFTPSYTYTQAGVYRVTLIISDPNACNKQIDSVSKDVTVFLNQSYSLDDAILCQGGSVKIGLEFSGGGNATYQWTPATGLSNTAIADPLANPSETTTYALLASNGVCTDTIKQTVWVKPLLEASFESPLDGCSPVSINFTNTSTSGNTANYQWNFGDGSPNATGINPTHLYSNPGTFLVTFIVNDSESCNLRDTISKVLTFFSDTSYSLPMQMICLGSSQEIGLLPSLSPYITYKWLNPVNLSNDTIANPIANPIQTIEYLLIASNGICQDTLSQIVEVRPVLGANFQAPLFGCTSGNIALNNISTGGTALIYSWYFNNILIGNDTNYTTVLTAGSYEIMLIVTDTTSCNGTDTIIRNFTVYADTSYTLPDAYICSGNNIQIGINPDLTGNTTYQWIPSTGLNSNTIANPISTTSQTTEYLLIATSSNGNCADTIRQKVDVTELTLAASDLSLCESDVVTLIPSVSASLPISYVWSTNRFFTDTINSSINDSSFTTTLVNDTVFYIKAFVDGCYRVDSVRIYVWKTLNDSLVEITPREKTIRRGSTTQISVLPATGYTYWWEPPAGLSDPTIPDPMAGPDVSTVYYITFIDGNNCYYTDSVTIYVVESKCEEPEIFVPTGFTPNGDGLNDVLYVRGAMIEELYFTIYNRWGEKVFETNDRSIGWDGTYLGMEADPGVFAYFLKVRCIEGQELFLKGNVTLIR